MSGLIGRKIGMTSLFDENGKNIPCTVIEAGPCVVTQVRTEEVDGYNALQLGFDDKKAKSSNKALDGHFKKAGTTAKKKVVEFQGFEEEYSLGDAITVSHFAEGEFVDVSGVSKGKGFQGVVKRHKFAGGRRSHGQKHSEREPGSIGATGIARVLKGTRMGGRMGSDTITVKGLKVLQVNAEENILVVSGAVPGRKGTLVEVFSTPA